MIREEKKKVFLEVSDTNETSFLSRTDSAGLKKKRKEREIKIYKESRGVNI